MKILPCLLLSLWLGSCTGQSETNSAKTLLRSSENTDSLEVVNYYEAKKGGNTVSQTKGKVEKGSLVNGKLLPFYGKNYTYFYKESYTAGRAFTSDVVRDILLATYADLETICPDRHFYLMELSNEKGGPIYPHRTHQNGLSADFMFPKLQNNLPFYALDTLGKDHYFLEFNDNGAYQFDTTIVVDFETMAHHVLLLEKNARKRGYKIGKVILKMEYKDELFATPSGKQLKDSGIYLVQKLTPTINAIHDDHYHIDFVKL